MNWYITMLDYRKEKLLLVRTENNKWILSHSDLVHYVRKGREDTVTLEWMDLSKAKIGKSILSLADLLEFESNDPVEKSDLAQWIHYFGIKDRVRKNYKLFRESLKELGIDPDSILPEWR